MQKQLAINPNQNDQDKGTELIRRDGADGFMAAARGGNTGGIVGTRLKYIKSEWIAGSGDAEDVLPIGTELLVDLNTLHLGFVKWEDGMPVDAVIVRVADNGRQPQRRDLGDLDKADWPVGDDGRVRDPWAPDARVYMVAIDSREEFTFVSSSWGGRFAIRDLCRGYVTARDEHPDEMPIVALGTYKRPDKKFGKIDTPTLEIVGWATLAEVTNGFRKPKKTPAKSAELNGKKKRAA